TASAVGVAQSSLPAETPVSYLVLRGAIVRSLSQLYAGLARHPDAVGPRTTGAGVSTLSVLRCLHPVRRGESEQETPHNGAEALSGHCRRGPEVRRAGRPE